MITTETRMMMTFDYDENHDVHFDEEMTTMMTK